jgi:hypothetical protein
LASQAPFPTPSERHPGRLLWYLIKDNNNLESAYQKWLAWVKWCRSYGTEKVTAEDISMEVGVRDVGMAV